MVTKRLSRREFVAGSVGAVLFSPFVAKDAKMYEYVIRGNVPALDGQRGEITAVAPAPDAALRPDPRWPNWWTDDPAPEWAEGAHIGAGTVSQWREDFLADFAARMRRCGKAARRLKRRGRRGIAFAEATVDSARAGT